MNSKAHHFRIGLFVLIASLLLFAGLFAIGLRSYFGVKDVYETFVTGKVENLSVGAVVMLRGVPIGKVNAIEFAGKEYPEFGDQYVLIEFETPKGTAWAAQGGDVQKRLDADAARGLRARVQGQGFLGASIIALEYVDPALYPADPVPWKPKHYYIPSAPSQINRVLASMEKILHQSEGLDLTNLLAHATAVTDSVKQLAHDLDQIDFKEIGTNANSLLVEVRQSNREVQKTLDSAQQTFADAQGAIKDANIPGIVQNTTAVEGEVSRTAAELRHTLSSVDMAELNSALANVRAASEQLNILLDKLQQQPSSLLFSHPPRPASPMDAPPKK